MDYTGGVISSRVRSPRLAAAAVPLRAYGLGTDVPGPCACSDQAPAARRFPLDVTERPVAALRLTDRLAAVAGFAFVALFAPPSNSRATRTARSSSARSNRSVAATAGQARRCPGAKGQGPRTTRTTMFGSLTFL